MSFLSPITALIAAGIAVPLLVALYFLKLRRREVVIPSTLLWKRAVQDLQVNAPFQKMRRNLLLLLQLLILAALLLAMARPTVQGSAAPGRRVVLLIDHSGSMSATDASPTRLDEAKRVALELIDTMVGAEASEEGSASGAMVISFADRAKVLQPFTSDPSRLRAAVRSIEPTDQRTRLGAALGLVEALGASSGGGPDSLVVHVLSDGRFPPDEPTALSLPNAELRYVRIAGDAGGGTVNNVGIVAFAARRDFDRPQLVQVFARLANYRPIEQRTNATLTVDGGVSRVEPVTLPAATATQPGLRSIEFDFALPGEAVVELSHDHADDLAADDTARLVLAPSRRLRVLVVTRGNAFLERVVRSVGVRELTLMTPDRYEDQDPRFLTRSGWDPTGSGSGEGYDVILFDGYAPGRVPPVDSVYFDAAPPIEGLELRRHDSREGGAQVVLDWRRDHPLLRHVVLDDLVMSEPGRLVLPTDATALATGPRGPIMAELSHAGTVQVVVAFDVLESSLPLAVPFVVMVQNMVETLGLGGYLDEAGLAYTTGDVATIPLPGGETSIVYEGPTRLSARRTDGRAVLPQFSRVGLYETDADVAPAFRRLAVNLLDPVESDLRSAERLSVGTEQVAAQTRDTAVRREVWPWFAWAALAVLLIEWLVYTRRMHL